MLRHPSAQKRHRQSLRRRARNEKVRSQVKLARKKLQRLLDAKGSAEIPKVLKAAVKAVSKATSKGVIHKRKAARLISRMTRKANLIPKAS